MANDSQSDPTMLNFFNDPPQNIEILSKIPKLRGGAVEADEEKSVGDDLHGAEEVGRRERHRAAVTAGVPRGGLGAPGHDSAASTGPETAWISHYKIMSLCMKHTCSQRRQSAA